MSEVVTTPSLKVTIPEPPRVPGLEVIDIQKRFGGVEALKGVSLWAVPGEVTALLGENGAGKSTVVKCLSGVFPPDSGEVRVAGEEVRFTSPLGAREAGVETVYQELGLVEYFDVTDNIFLGREMHRPWWQGRALKKKEMRKKGAGILADFGIRNLDPSLETQFLSGGQRQGVSIARATAWGATAIIMDEPTAALGVRESMRVMESVDRLRAANMTVLLVSHNIPQVLEIADRVWILRAGRLVAHSLASETNHAEVVSHITGMYSETSLRDNGSLAQG